MLDVHLNLNIRGMLPSATIEINERCQRLEEQGQQVYRLGLGQSPFPVPDVVVEELRKRAHEKAYMPVRGVSELRSAVAQYYRDREGIDASARDVLIGPGSKELMFLLQLVYYGDLVIPTPTWVSYAPQAEIIGRKVRWLPTRPEEHWRLTPERLSELCAQDPGRPRLVIINYPDNPTGGTYKLDELKDLARVARQNRVVLLSDEIYGELHYKGQHVSIARFYPEGTIISSGLSKWCGAGGWRLGHFLFPSSMKWLLDAMAAVASETYTATSAPIQYAAVRAYQMGPEVERYLRDVRRILGALGRHVTKQLEEGGLAVDPPRGGFYVFADFGPHRERLAERGIQSSTDLCARILEETGVAVLPGKAFGRPDDELTARLAFVNFDGERALTALASAPPDAPVNGRFLRDQCAPVLEAVERLAGWL